MSPFVDPLPAEQAAAALRRKGLRATRVLQSLHATPDQPLRIEELYRWHIGRSPTINPGSIAHALEDLERVGLLEVVDQAASRKRYRGIELADASAPKRIRLQAQGREAFIDDPQLLHLFANFLATELGLPLGPEPKCVSMQIDVWT